jgi:hypothetical protein
MADDFPTASLLRREAAIMMSIYYRDVVLSRVSDDRVKRES